MANRINKNLRWVKRQLDLAKAYDIIEEEILDAMSYAELEIMERTGSVKQTDMITFNSALPPVPPVNQGLGIYAFPVGVDRLVYIDAPTNWTRPMVLTEDFKTYDDIKKANINGNQPLVAFVQNALITFWPIPTDGEIITLHSFRTPKLDGSEAQVEGTGDPILSFHWDQTLRYMALATLIGGDWIKKAEEEYNREAHHHLSETGMPIQIDHSSRRLGF